MKRVKLALGALVFVGAVGSAFATKPAAQRNLYTKVSAPCHLIMCRTTQIGTAEECDNTDAKFTNNTCTTSYTGTAWEAPTL